MILYLQPRLYSIVRCLFKIYNQRIIALQHWVGFYQTSTWISHRFTMFAPTWTSLPPPSTSCPSRLLLSPVFRSLNHTANSHWLPILYMVMYISMLLSLYIVRCLFDIWLFFSFRFSNGLLLFFIFQIVESPGMIPKALHDQFLSQKALIILASSVSPESSKLPPAPRSLRSTCPSPEHSHPHAMANWFLLSPEASVFCYFSRGVSPPTLSTNKTGFVLTTPKSFYRIHTTIGSGLIFFYCLLVDC